MESFLAASDFGPTRREPQRQRRLNRDTLTPHFGNPTPPQSRSISPDTRYQELYTPRHKPNLLNFIDFLSEEIRPDNPHVKLLPDFVYDDEDGPIGNGNTMEVFATRWKGKGVAVKRLKREIVPSRNNDIPIERNTAYVKARDQFYQKVQDLMQEILIMCRVSCSSQF
jgi:hypothetical protein